MDLSAKHLLTIKKKIKNKKTRKQIKNRKTKKNKKKFIKRQIVYKSPFFYSLPPAPAKPSTEPSFISGPGAHETDVS